LRFNGSREHEPLGPVDLGSRFDCLVGQGAAVLVEYLARVRRPPRLVRHPAVERFRRRVEEDDTVFAGPRFGKIVL
jgi:hypothetical protein